LRPMAGNMAYWQALSGAMVALAAPAFTASPCGFRGVFGSARRISASRGSPDCHCLSY
jgi:hypothetical protein